MPTMTHTAEQKKAWHAGKKKHRESDTAWFRRVVVKGRNFRGAKRIPSITYKALRG